MVTIRLKDKETKKQSNEIQIDEVIYNQNEIEFEFEDGTTLPYKDFLFYQSDYEVIIHVGKE